MSDSECTTDAMPSPPRDKENIFIPNKGKKTKVQPKEEFYSGEENTDPRAKFHYDKGQQVNNIIQIINSPYARVGHDYIYESREKRKAAREAKIQETEKIAELKESMKPVLDVDIDALKHNIGANCWETFRKLGFLQAQIEQHKLQNHGPYSEFVRSVLVCWRQKHGKDAQVCMLACALWNSGEREALQKWSLQYDKLHETQK